MIRGGAVGDFILTLPAIRLLRDSIPGVRVELLGYRPILALAEASGLAEEVRSIEHGALAGFFVPGGVLDPDWCGYFGSFDLVVSYLFDPDGYFKANLGRAGVETLVEGTPRVDESLGTHAASQLARPLESLAMFLDDPAPAIETGPVPADLAARLAPGPSPRVAIHPGSGSPRKNWGFENWVAVARALAAREPGTRFVVTSGEAEHETIRAFLDLLQAAGIEALHAAERPLPEVASILGTCDLYLGHDSGISHLAGAVGTPAVVVFGPTDPQIWAPCQPWVRVVRAPGGRLGELAPEEVAAAAAAVLDAADRHGN